MKKLLVLAVFGGLMTLGGSALADPILIAEGPYIGTDVGFEDDYINHITQAELDALIPLTGIAQEIAWLNYVLGTTYAEDDVIKFDDPEKFLTNLDDVVAISLTDGPEYFWLKTGNLTSGPGGPTTALFLYENFEALRWGVVNLNEWYSLDETWNNINIGVISHVGQSVPVPEPVTILFVGLGLVGLAALRKRF